MFNNIALHSIFIQRSLPAKTILIPSQAELSLRCKAQERKTCSLPPQVPSMLVSRKSK